MLVVILTYVLYIGWILLVQMLLETNSIENYHDGLSKTTSGDLYSQILNLIVSRILYPE